MASDRTSTFGYSLPADVAIGGTVVIPYPAGLSQSMLSGNMAARNTVVLNNNDIFKGGTGVAFAFSATGVTLTNNTGRTWRANERINVVLDLGQDLSGSLLASPVVATQASTTYTLQTGDNARVLRLDNAAAITATLPANLPLGFNTTVVQAGAGQVTFAAASGATLRQRSGLGKTAGQWAAVTALVIGQNAAGTAAEWLLMGDLG